MSSAGDWLPSAGLEALRLRARVLAHIRTFFQQAGVLEVETPVLAGAGATDPHIESLATRCRAGARPLPLYLQTSPEFAMKRLLAAGSGPIYQMSRAFRDGESGRLHNPEFTLLEWYRPGFDTRALMDEIDALLDEIFERNGTSRRLTYRQAFVDHAAVDPFESSDDALAAQAVSAGLDSGSAAGAGRDTLLEFLFSHLVQPSLGGGRVFVHDYPASQAALARIRADAPPVAERFELFVDGIEIANGYHELADAAEQRRRFESDNAAREALGRAPMPLDERLLAALEHGLPDCAGVAVGLDRLIMLAAGETSIDAVMAFPIDRA